MDRFREIVLVIFSDIVCVCSVVVFDSTSVALTLPEEIRFFRFVSIDATAKNIADKLLPEAESAGSTYMAMLDR